MTGTEPQGDLVNKREKQSTYSTAGFRAGVHWYNTCGPCPKTPASPVKASQVDGGGKGLCLASQRELLPIKTIILEKVGHWPDSEDCRDRGSMKVPNASFGISHRKDLGWAVSLDI